VVKQNINIYVQEWDNCVRVWIGGQRMDLEFLGRIMVMAEREAQQIVASRIRARKFRSPLRASTRFMEKEELSAEETGVEFGATDARGRRAFCRVIVSKQSEPDAVRLEVPLRRKVVWRGHYEVESSGAPDGR
jgi:hypothetical protein